jgi:hypothetical protein
MKIVVHWPDATVEDLDHCGIWPNSPIGNTAKAILELIVCDQAGAEVA